MRPLRRSFPRSIWITRICLRNSSYCGRRHTEPPLFDLPRRPTSRARGLQPQHGPSRHSTSPCLDWEGSPPHNHRLAVLKPLSPRWRAARTLRGHTTRPGRHRRIRHDSLPSRPRWTSSPAPDLHARAGPPRPRRTSSPAPDLLARAGPPRSRRTSSPAPPRSIPTPAN